jgi:hypothetical protein
VAKKKANGNNANFKCVFAALLSQKWVCRLHILPKRFVRIRPGGEPHFGILSSTWKREKFKKIKEAFKIKQPEAKPKGTLLNKCRCCKVGNLVTIAAFDGRGPPAEYLGMGQNQSNRKS